VPHGKAGHHRRAHIIPWSQVCDRPQSPWCTPQRRAPTLAPQPAPFAVFTPARNGDRGGCDRSSP
jgi:hypothetical protein